MTKHLVRVTQEPGVVREVDSAELIDLARSGIIHSYEKTEETKAVFDSVGILVFPVVARWKGAGSSSEIVTAPAAMTDPAGSQAVAVGTDTKEG